MNKKEMANELAKKIGVSQVKAMEAINAVFDPAPGKGIIATELDSGNKVVLAGFGTFSVRQRAARTAVHPGTQKKIEVASKTYAHFKPGKNLREFVG